MNLLTKMYSGIFGQQVILEPRGGKIIMTFPHKRKVPVPTERQIDYRTKFKRASKCATNILKNPEVLKAYRARVRKGQTAYNLALRDFLGNRIGGSTSLHDLPCFDSGAGTDLQKTDPRGQTGKRNILFSVPGDLKVHDRVAAHARYRGIRWTFPFTRLFMRERTRGRAGIDAVRRL
ncbi:MAG: hypothetical protein Q8M08_00130 [Bacteroidales bacterium]|nr:hypothetical protein [Bacteroidales bacterium]